MTASVAQKKLQERDSASRDRAPVAGYAKDAARVVSGDGWTLYLGDADKLVPALSFGDPLRLRAIADGPYGTGTYPTDVDNGVVVRVLRALGRSRTVSFFGFPELLVGWCARLGWHVPDEWVTWWPANAAVKAGGRARLLPKQIECIAIFGDIPGADRLTYERSEASKKKPQNAHLPANARLGDVWTDASPGMGFNARDRKHPNEKPESLLEKLVLLTSEPDDLVVDPFMGSGTTGAAAIRLGRRFVGIEKDPKFFAAAVARLREATS